MSEIVATCKKHGNLTQAMVNNQKKCNECARDRSRMWRQLKKDEVNKRVSEDRKNNPEKYREYDRKWRANNLEKDRISDIVNRRKMTIDQYKNMFESQDHKCAICGKEEYLIGRAKTLMPLSVDHCHKCDHHIRSLLCHDCNVALGKSNDDISILESAINYLLSHQ